METAGTWTSARRSSVRIVRAPQRGCRLREIGVELLNAAPAHPQTLGKLERFHRTLKEWLSEEAPARDLDELQALLERFRVHYNEERPHQGIADRTPAERYRGEARAGACGLPALASLR